MSKHTPGPWKAIAHDGPLWKICATGGEFHVVAITAQGNDEANACLIAAAPKLLAACVRALDAFGADRTPSEKEDAQRHLHAAIKEATP